MNDDESIVRDILEVLCVSPSCANGAVRLGGDAPQAELGQEAQHLQRLIVSKLRNAFRNTFGPFSFTGV